MPEMSDRAMTWSEIVSSFHVATLDNLLSLPGMTRHQEVRPQLRWLAEGDPPLALFFVSHRWASPEHPDPRDELMRSIQAFFRLVLAAVEASLLPREARVHVMPAISREGALQ